MLMRLLVTTTVLLLALDAGAAAPVRLVLRCDFCGAAPANRDPTPLPGYPAPPAAAGDTVPPAPPLPSPDVRVLEGRLQSLDASLRGQPTLAGESMALIAGSGLAALLAVLPLITAFVFLTPDVFDDPDSAGAEVVLFTIGIGLTGTSVVLGLLAVDVERERTEVHTAKLAERNRLRQQLELLKAPPRSALPEARTVPRVSLLRF